MGSLWSPFTTVTDVMRKFKVVKKSGSAGYIKKSLGSISTFNTMKAGFIPATEFTISRKSSPHCPSPRPLNRNLFE